MNVFTYGLVCTNSLFFSQGADEASGRAEFLWFSKQQLRLLEVLEIDCVSWSMDVKVLAHRFDGTT